MSQSFRWRRWRPSSQSAGYGIELIAAGTLESLASRLAWSSRDTESGRAIFQLIRLATTDQSGLEAAVQLVGRHSQGRRVSLAIDRLTLANLGSDFSPGGHVGLLLDDVDAETPLSEVTREILQAIRFRPAFALGAKVNVRTRIALDSFLSAAHGLGIVTLGPSMTARSLDRTALFDYVSSDVDRGELEVTQSDFRFARMPQATRARLEPTEQEP